MLETVSLGHGYLILVGNGCGNNNTAILITCWYNSVSLSTLDFSVYNLLSWCCNTVSLYH